MASPNGRSLATGAAHDDNEPLLEHTANIPHPQHVSPSLVGSAGPRSHPLSLDDKKFESRTGADPRSSLHSSRSVSTDLELDNIRHDDPLYSNGAGDVRNRVSWGQAKHQDWVDTGQDDTSMHPADREKEARRLGNRQFIQKTLINALLIALWYILSIAMSVYNKWMFSPGNLDFHFPLFSTSVHMLIQFFLASLILFLFPQFRPERAAADPHDSEGAPKLRGPEGPRKHLMTPWFYLTRIASCGDVTGLDIGLGNTSLKFISLTFFTMVKSSTLGFVLGFAILFRLEAPSWKIGGIIAVMTLGVILMVSGETAFDGLGFALLMLASFFSGLRWSLTQILLRRTPATSNPFSTLFFLTPVMFIVLFLLAIPSETFGELGKGLNTLAAQQGLFVGILIVLFPGCIAFCMTSAEFALLKRTSVVTLSVCGIFKEVLTITAAGIIFGDELTPINISGLLITIIAIAVYNWTRMRRMKRMEISKARDGASGADTDAEIAGTSTAGPSAATTEEGAPMLPSASQFGKESGEGTDRDYTAAAASGQEHTRASQDDEDDDDADDVVMIEGGVKARGQSRLEPMREPVRAFFKQDRPGGGYAAL